MPPPLPPPPNFAALSNKLAPQMTEADVQAVMGGPPRSTDLTTCGAAVGTPFRCKSWTYGNALIIFFGADQRGTWRVLGWGNL